MKAKILFLLLFIVGYNLLLAGQDTTTNISDEKKIYREKIEDKCEEYLIAQDYRGAIDFLTKEIAVQDIKADDYYLKNTGYFIAMRGLAYYYLQEYDSALEDINKSIKIVPEWSDAYFFRGLVRFERGQYKAASADYSKAIKLEKNNKQYYFASGNVYLRQRKYEDAIEDYTKSINLDTNWAVPYYNRGVAKDNLQDYQGAVADLKKAIELDPDPVFMCFLSDIYFRHNDINAAIDIAILGLKKDSTSTPLYNNLGRFYLEKGNNDKADSNFSKCIELDSENFRTPLYISILFYNKNDKINSKKYLDQAKKIEPRLDKGIDGFDEIEASGHCQVFSENMETLAKMFDELK
jgi:tetratricopeptide (TPR) repeat protein